ncbi:DUF86 domain-containing protein [uncultured Mucilaginibacter sp.]|uniref:HepT-like ribonuclease domain-containing protein n=1 Tax=uncultured Mucilaginibacter sp. TaxID=797541 RepID=UPI0025D648C9|nr:DUF86 domain-containing protein [uncultured Mucilaginibacter sp.]
MSRSDLVYFNDIIESIDLILEYLDVKTELEFRSNFLLQDAVIRRFEIIGEASSKVSESSKQLYPSIPWNLMKAMRNKLIHEYFGVSAQTIYETAKRDLPVLKEQLLKII